MPIAAHANGGERWWSERGGLEVCLLWSSVAERPRVYRARRLARARSAGHPESVLTGLELELYRRGCDSITGAAGATAFAGLLTGHLIGALVAGGAGVMAQLLRLEAGS